MKLLSMSKDSPKALTALWVGTAMFLVGLCLPLFKAVYQPPGGYQVFDGRQVDAFSLRVTGLQFAHAAPSARIWILTGLLVLLAFVRTGLYFRDRQEIAEARPIPAQPGSAESVRAAVADPSKERSPTSAMRAAHTMASSVVALGWLGALTLAILLAGTPIVHPAVPLGGGSAVLSTFQHPFSPGPTFETTYLHLALGIGMPIMIVGIILCLASNWKVAGAAFVVYALTAVILLIVHAAVHEHSVDSILQWIRSILFV